MLECWDGLRNSPRPHARARFSAYLTIGVHSFETRHFNSVVSLPGTVKEICDSPKLGGLAEEETARFYRVLAMLKYKSFTKRRFTNGIKARWRDRQ